MAAFSSKDSTTSGFVRSIAGLIAMSTEITTMSYGSIQLSDSATGETIGHLQGVVADFGARVANLRDLPSVHTSPAMAESAIVNGEAQGAVAVIQRGAVPLVEKARRAQSAGAAAALIVNADERPLLAHDHRHRDGSYDSGQDDRPWH